MPSGEDVGNERQKRECRGSQRGSWRRLKSKSLITVVLVSLLVSLLTTSLATPVSAQEDYTVTIGQDKVFRTCNIQRTSTAVAPSHPGQGDPTVIYASSDGQQAFTHILAETYQEGNAKGWAGVNFSVEAPNSGEVAQAEISITMS